MSSVITASGAAGSRKRNERESASAERNRKNGGGIGQSLLMSHPMRVLLLL